MGLLAKSIMDGGFSYYVVQTTRVGWMAEHAKMDKGVYWMFVLLLPWRRALKLMLWTGSKSLFPLFTWRWRLYP